MQIGDSCRGLDGSIANLFACQRLCDVVTAMTKSAGALCVLPQEPVLVARVWSALYLAIAFSNSGGFTGKESAIRRCLYRSGQCRLTLNNFKTQT